ncbi:MAG TPA: hypothetical protein VKR06_44135 [Ktedonosporobacter sp.]|nr:hypothetical protein [Ktedonosporobacter sp.]
MSFRAFEYELMGQLLRVYEWEVCCVRIDTTSASSYAQINEEGRALFSVFVVHFVEQ